MPDDLQPYRKRPTPRAPALPEISPAIARQLAELQQRLDGLPTSGPTSPQQPSAEPSRPDPQAGSQQPAAEVTGGVTAVRTSGRSRQSAGRRLSQLLIVVLLGAAAGLGTAAAVLSRPQTWEASSAVLVVPLDTGASPQAPSKPGASAETPTVKRLEGLVNGEFLSASATSVGVPPSRLRRPTVVVRDGSGRLRFMVWAADADQAKAVARAVANRFVDAVVADQAASSAAQVAVGSANQVDAGGPAIQITPTKLSAGIAGGVAAAVVIGLADLIAVRAGSRRRRRA